MEIELTVDRFENDIAVLVTSDKKSINWPKNKLPAGVKESSVVYISINSSKQATEGKKEQAKSILNELLNTGEEK